MIERLAAPFPTHPIPCRLWSILATGIDRSRVCGLPPRREGKTHGRGGSPIRLIGSRCAHEISDSPRSSPMYGTSQSRIFAALRLDAPDPSARQSAAFLRLPGRRDPSPGSCSGPWTRAASRRGTAGDRSAARALDFHHRRPPYPHAPRAAAHAMASPCSSGRPAGNPRHDLRGVTASREGRDDQRMRCRCPARAPPSPGASRSTALAERGHMHRSGDHRFGSPNVRIPSASPRRPRRAHPVMLAPPPPAAWR